jgi:hypothetical protein
MQAKNAYELEQQIQNIFAPIPLDFLRKSVEPVSSRLQKFVQNVEAYVEI